MKAIVFFVTAFFLFQSLAAVIDVQRRAAPETPTIYSLQTSPLDTPWTSQLGENPWPEHPRPRLQRTDWQSLNGIWKYRNASTLHDPIPFNEDLPHEVLVPSCLESAISGIQGHNTLYSWFSRNFTVPSRWNGGRVLLNFGAVDYETTLYINGKTLGINRGGYATFTFDITDYIFYGDTLNVLLLFVFDPTDAFDHVVPVGKQTLNPNHYFYTACSGIWQSVWLESTPVPNFVTRLDLNGDMNGLVSIAIHTASNSQEFAQITIHERGRPDAVIIRHDCNTNSEVEFNVTKQIERWAPDSPSLYDVEVKVGQDIVRSYIGFRSFETRAVGGVLRPMLNGEFFFPFGTLDQGYWPDGIYVAPNRKAMMYDLQMLKAVGFNMVRKHIKIEPSLFYTACDEMGLLVMQDMPSPRAAQKRNFDNCTSSAYLPNEDEQADFVHQLEVMVTQLKSHPSIFGWTIYNEGWGQLLTQQKGRYQEFSLVDLVKFLDPTRLISATSGWTDHGAGDFSDTHTYASPKCGTPFYKIPSLPYDKSRIAFQGEFGGIGHNLTEDHLWKVPAAMDTINQTYEINHDLETFNYRARQLLRELREQVELFDCSGAVWTQTTDVEGELNGLLSYDRRVLRPDLQIWRTEIQALYDAAAKRGARKYSIGEPIALKAAGED